MSTCPTVRVLRSQYRRQGTAYYMKDEQLNKNSKIKIAVININFYSGFSGYEQRLIILRTKARKHK